MKKKKPHRKPQRQLQRRREERPAVGQPVQLPEILAPAGTPAAWAAAVEAGADAVYLGRKLFSARAFASNFTDGELARLVEISHDRGVKVFVAFNTQLKEKELPVAARSLDVLARIKPDALIIQDLGLLRLIKQHFPQFEVHASTLMAGHNLPGLSVLADLGFDRAVLARELTLDEIDRLTRTSPLKLEVFIHGALCFSFSGLCLMSSYLGGKGSLRGACTQPCRRVYTQGGKKGSFFSPTDLSAARVMARLRRMPLSAFKIEGRMKGPEYVSRVVRAYRLLLDTPDEDLQEAMPEAEALLAESLGRQASTGFFLSPRAEEGLSPHRASTSGLFLGVVEEASDGGGRATLRASVALGDRLRAMTGMDEEQRAFKLTRLEMDGESAGRAEEGDQVWIFTDPPLKKGDRLFKVDSAKGEKDARQSPLLGEVEGAPEFRTPEASAALKRALAGLRPVGGGARAGSRPSLWYRVSRAEEISSLAELKPDRIILPLTTANVKRMAGLRRKLDRLYDAVVWSLPPLVFEGDVAGLMRDLNQLARMGARNFMVSNLGHLPLVNRDVKGRRGKPVIYADHRLGCLNTEAEQALAGLGVAGVTLSVETDAENLEAMFNRPGPVSRLVYLYGRPPLFTSRFQPTGLKANQAVESPKRERFRLREEPGMFSVFAEKPVYMAPLLKMKALPGVEGFIIDLENDPRPIKTARDIHDAVRRGKRLGGTTFFNLQRGLF